MRCSPQFDLGLLAASCMYIHSSLPPSNLLSSVLPFPTQHTITLTPATSSVRLAKPSERYKMTPPAVTKEVIVPAEEGTDSGVAKKQKVGGG